ncbi:MAG: CRTAC1 family protein [Planctomycetota bacterium]|jgi:hypothetical protein
MKTGWMRVASLLLALPLAACGGDDGAAPAKNGGTPAGGASAPKPEPEAPPALEELDRWVSFVPLGEESGFRPINHTGIPEDKHWIAEAMGGGLITLDYDGDGDQDILFVDGNALDREPIEGARTRLFRNDGDFKFTDVTKAAGIDITIFSYGGAAADYDGDGDVDVFVGSLGKNHLLRNNGDGTFTDVGEESGLAGSDRDMSTACAWGDLNGDGHLDLYVSNYIDMWTVIEDFKKEGRVGRSCKWRGFDVYCGPQGLPFQADRLYMAKGDGTFTDASDRLADQEVRPAFQALMVDFDGDGDLDIYVANDTEPNTLWVNDGQGNFLDDGMISGCAVNSTVAAQAGMGADAGDYDNDGLIDIIVTNFSHDHFTLYQNTTGEPGPDAVLTFEDVSVRTGVSQATYTALGWGANFLDADNDGDLDLFFANGHVYGQIDNFADSGTSFRQKNLLLRNGGGPRPKFSDVSAASGPGLAVEEVHRGSVTADLDNDGDLDFVVSSLNGPAYVMRNDGGNEGNWIRISLQGKAPRDPAGAVVRVTADGLPDQTRIALRGRSFMGASDPRLIVGMRDATTATAVVTWPSGETSTFTDLAAGKHWLLVEGAEKADEQGR